MRTFLSFALLLCPIFCFAQHTNPAPPPPADQVTRDKAKAAKGDTAAMFHLGMYYSYGQGMPQDFNKAKIWLQKAADKGHVNSMLELGAIYAAGKGGKKDPVKAMALFRKAAKKGDAEAMYDIGMMYEEGNGVKKDMAEALKNYKDAAEKGSLEAMNAVALCYVKGIGTTRDVQVARQWLEKAADKGDIAATVDIAFFYRSPDLGNDCKKAVTWFMKAKEMGDTASLTAVGEMVMEGKCKDLELKTVTAWIKKYADEGEGDACFFMAAFYIEGIGVEHNYSKAMTLLMRAGEELIKRHAKENEAIDELFSLYDSGKLSAEDMTTLLKWLEEAADKTNDGDLMAGIGYIYTNKENATKKDYTKAMAWSTKSADKGNPTGFYNIGYLYANGLGVMKDDKKGFEWIMKAAVKGDRVAMQTISEFYENGQGVPHNHEQALEWKAKAKAGLKEDAQKGMKE